MKDKIKQVFDISGMSCSACAAHIDKSVNKLDGVEDVNVNLLQNKMTLSYDPEKLNISDITKAVHDSGYEATLANDLQNQKHVDQKKNVDHEDIKVRKRLVLSFCFLIPLLYIAMGHMAGFPLPDFISGHKNMLVMADVQLLLTLPIIYLNRKYFENGLKMLFKGSPTMDSLIAIGSGASFLYSIYSVIMMGYYLGHSEIMMAHTYSSELYFESAGTILTLITFGKYLEAKSKKKTSEAIDKLVKLMPKTANVIRNGVEMEIPSEELLMGDTIIIRSGQRIPVDGVIIEGNGAIDESAITGESLPVEKNKNDSVISATINN